MKIFSNPFRLPTDAEIRTRVLAEAKRQKERSQYVIEEHAAAIALCDVRIARLEGSVVPLHHAVVKGPVR